MEIHFCDLCNESVPQSDLDEGRAMVRKGRVVCAACDRAMSHHEATLGPAPAQPFGAGFDTGPLAASVAGPFAVNEPPPALASSPAAHAMPHVQPARRAGSGGLWIALLGLMFTAGAIFVVDERLKAIEAQQQDSARSLEAHTLQVNSLQRRAAEAEMKQQETDRRATQRIEIEKARRDELTAELTRMQRENTDLTGRLATLGATVATLEEKAGNGNFDLEKRVADLSARLARGEDDARAMTEKISTLEAAAPAVVTAVPVAEPKAAETGWHLQLPNLKNDSSSTRWEAVTTLGATKDPDTVPYLTPMLKDGDIFVRMAAARVLGEMLAKPAVPALIDALEDSETAVREAANIALRTITTKDFKFDPLAIEAERARRVKAWREWWKKEGESPSGM